MSAKCRPIVPTWALTTSTSRILLSASSADTGPDPAGLFARTSHSTLTASPTRLPAPARRSRSSSAASIRTSRMT